MTTPGKHFVIACATLALSPLLLAAGWLWLVWRVSIALADCTYDLYLAWKNN